MAHQPTVTETRLAIITAHLTPAVRLFNELYDAFGISFVQPISKTTLSLVTAVQNAKRNRDECISLMENIHQVLYGIVNIHMKSEPVGAIPPHILDQIGNFTETLNKIHTYVEAQQEGSKIRHFLRQGEMNTLLKQCRSGMEMAVEAFKCSDMMEFALGSLDNVGEMKQRTESMHNELLELISKLSDGTVSDRSSSVYQDTLGQQNSSKSFSMLPSRPKLFYGRESVLEDVLKTLAQDSPRIAILGAGGMGKTALAKAVLHHADVSAKFEHRYFVSAESATTSIELAALIGLHLGLNPGKNLAKPVVRHLSRQPPCLLILDNLETPWEGLESRGGVEEFLSLLTDVPHLALMITMRGAERPAKVAWSRPFLQPLRPLSDDAAQQTFMDITDNVYDLADVTQLLQFTDNMPLAVDLIAHLVDYEGHANVLTRWKTERTTLLSVGNDRRSSLDASIKLSLSSPRITSDARDLLSLLSILPDGLSDAELLQSNFPIQDIMGCKSALLSTALGYNDNQKRLRSLIPIREHVQQFYPPLLILTRPLEMHFHQTLDLYMKYITYNQALLGAILGQITSNLGNLQQVLHLGLHADNPNVPLTIICILNLNSFHRITGRGHSSLMKHIPAILSQLSDSKLEVQFIAEVLLSDGLRSMYNPELLIAQGISQCDHLNDPEIQSKFYQRVAIYHTYFRSEMSTAMLFHEKALELSRSCGDTNRQSFVLSHMAIIKLHTGDTRMAEMHISEARRLAKLSGNLYVEAYTLGTSVSVMNCLGRYQESLAQARQGRKLLALCGIHRGTVHSHRSMDEAEVHMLKSEYNEARHIYLEVARNNDQDPFIYACALSNIAQIDVIIGAVARDVAHNMNKAKEIFSSMDHQPGIGACKRNLADLALREGDPTSAKDMFQDCLNFVWGKPNDIASCCLESLADRNRWPGQFTFTWPMVYVAHASRSKERLALHKALLFLGDVYIAQEDEATARSLFQVALEGFIRMDVHRSRAQCLLRLGDLAHKAGDLSTAMELWAAARPLFARSSQTQSLTHIDARLAPARLDEIRDVTSTQSESSPSV
ncbi:hypothetical protein B0H14DRAFT_3163428 [Mycena olivaceomarginata]|nr:hypothetical protein B0H14DRAFT_3163428 [Mycena olivaceomarginata]